MEYSPLYRLADRCRAARYKSTVEKNWLREKCEQLYQRTGAPGKREGDLLLYNRVFGRSPQKESDILKVRYWRTGRTMPGNRSVLLSLGRALELSEKDMAYLVQRYYDRNDQVFTGKETDMEVYRNRVEWMNTLKEEFLRKQHPLYLRHLGIRSSERDRNFRHLYYLDSMQYIADGADREWSDHEKLISVSYGSTLRDLMELRGEIRRRNIIRHLIILLSPFLSRSRMNESLIALGFLPLTPDHHLPGGGKMDELLLGILEMYETVCEGESPDACRRWLKNTLRSLDQYLIDIEAPELRFMQYKSIAGKTGNPSDGEKPKTRKGRPGGLS